MVIDRLFEKKNPNHTSLCENYVVPCICLMVVMTYAWFDVTRNLMELLVVARKSLKVVLKVITAKPQP